MKLKLLALAVVGTCAAAPAFALTPAASAAAVTAGRVVYASGASAPTFIVYSGVRGLCQPGSIDAYSTNNLAAASAPGQSAWGNFLAYTCKFKVGLTDPNGVAIPWSNQDVAFIHTVADGSFKSVEGMSTAVADQVEFIVDAFTGCVDSTFLVTGTGDKIWESCSRAKKRSHGGFSDVEKAIFQDLTAGIPGVNAANVEVTPANAGQTFGIATSLPLYRAMQTAQGIGGTCTDGGADDFAVACQPSITKRDYSSLVNNDPFSPTKVDWEWLVGAPGIGVDIFLERRVPTSGTQASSNVYFLDNPCARGPATSGERGPAGNVDQAPPDLNITEHSSSSNVKTGLNSAVNWAIGVLSGENNPSGAETWHWIKLDGVAINVDANNRQTAIDGKYDFAFELVLHTLAGVTPVVPGQVLKTVADRLGDPTTANLRGLFVIPNGAFSNTSHPLQVSKGTRNGNSCSPFVF